MLHRLFLSIPTKRTEVRHHICKVCWCYDACLPKNCPGYPVPPTMHGVYHCINDLIKLHIIYDDIVDENELDLLKEKLKCL